VKISLFTLLILISCSADEEDFDNMARDICHCMTDSTVNDPEQCMFEFQQTYEHLNSNDSDNAFQKKLVVSMKKVKGCKEYAEFYESSLGNLVLLEIPTHITISKLECERGSCINIPIFCRLISSPLVARSVDRLI